MKSLIFVSYGCGCTLVSIDAMDCIINTLSMHVSSYGMIMKTWRCMFSAAEAYDASNCAAWLTSWLIELIRVFRV